MHTHTHTHTRRHAHPHQEGEAGAGQTDPPPENRQEGEHYLIPPAELADDVQRIAAASTTGDQRADFGSIPWRDYGSNFILTSWCFMCLPPGDTRSLTFPGAAEQEGHFPPQCR